MLFNTVIFHLRVKIAFKYTTLVVKRENYEAGWMKAEKFRV